MTTTDLLAECHAVLTGCACNRCDVCRVRRLIAVHEPAVTAPDVATLHRWYPTMSSLEVTWVADDLRARRSEARL